MTKSIVRITDTKTGEERSFEDDFDDSFIWEDGSYACDCNRALFFERVMNPEFKGKDAPCGNGRYSIQIETKDGTLLYRDP